MEKRILLFFALSMVVLYAFRLLAPPEPPPIPETEKSATSAQGQPAVPVVPTPPVTAPSPEAGGNPAIAAESIQAEGPQDVLVGGSALYSATLSNVGGVLRSYKLKFPEEEVELINVAAAEKLGWPLAIVSGDAALDTAISQANYKVRQDGYKVELEFAAEGVHVRKSLEFSRENYELKIVTELSKAGLSIPHRVVWQGGFGDQSIPFDPVTKFAVIHTGTKFERFSFSNVETQTERTSPRAGVEDQYFLAMFLSATPVPFHVLKHDFTAADKTVIETFALSAPMTPDGYRVYVGPKSQAALAKADPLLEAVIDYGFFGFITKPLIAALLWIHGYVGNFGWAIIILTCAINLALFPLRLKQQVSMQKMQKLQPQVRTLQDKLKKLKANDPRKAEIQTEMMNLYSANGVNPMGGCLPLLLQMPFLWAFWSMLSISIELRHAPWILWIRDLSQHDPYYVIPILMAISMIVMQKMTPTTVDPMQAKMMMIMPLIFAFMFLKYQSGLTLYWLTSNVVGIGQQVFISKYWTPATEEPKKHPRAAKNKTPTTE